MNQYELQNKLRELDRDEEFIAQMAACNTLDEAVSIFGEKGIDVSVEDLQKGLQTVGASVENGEELNEDMLESVSGGVAFATLCAVWMCCNIVIAGCNLLQNTVFKKRK